MNRAMDACFSDDCWEREGGRIWCTCLFLGCGNFKEFVVATLDEIEDLYF